MPKKKENVQDAHEGIRPTSILRTPEEVKPYLTSDEYNSLAMDDYKNAVLYSVYDKLTTYYENALERLSQRDLSSLITEKEYY